MTKQLKTGTAFLPLRPVLPFFFSCTFFPWWPRKPHLLSTLRFRPLFPAFLQLAFSSAVEPGSGHLASTSGLFPHPPLFPPSDKVPPDGLERPARAADIYSAARGPSRGPLFLSPPPPLSTVASKKGVCADFQGYRGSVPPRETPLFPCLSSLDPPCNLSEVE